MIHTGAEVRQLCRAGKLRHQTSGLAPGFVQANMYVLPKAHADAFKQFCLRNPKPCPLLDVTPCRTKTKLAADVDLATDLPQYCVFRDGKLVDTVSDVSDLWAEDMVAFLLGCSFSFEEALLDAGLPVRHVEEGVNVPMFVTDVDTAPAGPFHGKVVASMRPMTPAQAKQAAAVTAEFPAVHGAPLAQGQGALGVTSLEPQFGDRVTVKDGEIPVFWACGVTPQLAVQNAKLPLVITHAPGKMLVTDWKNEDLKGDA